MITLFVSGSWTGDFRWSYKLFNFFLIDVLSQPLCNRLQRDCKHPVTSMTTGVIFWVYPKPKYQSQNKTPTTQTTNPLLVHLRMVLLKQEKFGPKFFWFISLLSLNWEHDRGSSYSHEDILRCHSLTSEHCSDGKSEHNDSSVSRQVFEIWKARFKEQFHPDSTFSRVWYP